ncbi:MAG TPA: VanZ family protein [Fimbriimonadaceae bacterium]|nr:VanZ family protein [Fimbriimonadaceae bacterium]
MRIGRETIGWGPIPSGIGLLLVAYGLGASILMATPPWLLPLFGVLVLLGLPLQPGLCWGGRLSWSGAYVCLFVLVWLVSKDPAPGQSVAWPWIAVGAGIALAGGPLWLSAFRTAEADRSAWRPARMLLATVAVGLLVAWFSGRRGGPEPMVEFFSGWWFLSPEAVERIVIGLRKSAHVLFYGSFAWLTARATVALAPKAPRARVVAFAVLFVLAHAVFDETRQAFTPGRTGTPWDVLLDLGGMLAATLLLDRPRRN